MDRRDFLRLTTGGLLAACTEPLFAGTHSDFWDKPRRIWAKREVRKGVWEEVNEYYFVRGQLYWPGYVAICRFMRDTRENKSVQMSPVLFDILYGMQGTFELNGERRVIVLDSGYRTKRTNEAVGGVGDSRHMRGGAADVYFPGASVSFMKKIALNLRGGGVGFYPSNGFVHVDDGDLRIWRG
ncbi:YcbK family protein [Ralstonia pseudosolanacearum]|uniref:YcbK family protein n=1 Tax=Ralstonia pseudosolanacearum TaxID=1310165 RepID=UPI003CFB3943